ncbi:MAG: ZIP family metal transporter [Chthoniobacter sp. 12-60-6]|nr:MAG: ZIP family metal transporter [Chthoniobacter sp. 12-60-6]
MNEWFFTLHPALQALLGGTFTWGVTALGSALVLLTAHVNRKLLDSMEGFASGVMIAASYWSLLAPAIEMSVTGPLPVWFAPASGFILGGGFLWCIDKVLPHLHRGRPVCDAEGIKTAWDRNYLLILAITLHNIPEGLAVGVAFGAAAQNLPSASLSAAVALTFGIGLQNFPEGLAISLPLRREGMSRLRSFYHGQASALVEPVAAVIGASVVMWTLPVLPYALSFAAGAMIFVVIEELVPESHLSPNHDLATLAALAGFSLMMILDLAFG